ncbi:choline transporter-like protein 1 [Clavelina lepadiformis]|uniref:choline transporter-like protein 1 n=1 Tax=Clavelina lepadiformis TaxID=159417 RepID=UPI004042A9E1
MVGNYNQRYLSNDDFSLLEDPYVLYSRKTKDVLCLLLFVVSLCGMGFIAYYSFDKGDIARYTNGVDSWGNVCGRKKNPAVAGARYSGLDHSQRPNQFHFGYKEDTASAPPFYFARSGGDVIICVKTCSVAVTCRDLLSQNGYDLNRTDIERVICDERKSFLPHVTLINRCIPESMVENGVDENSIKLIQYVIKSATTYKRDIGHVIGLSIVVAIVVLMTLRYKARATTAFVSMLLGLGCVVAVGYFWRKYVLRIVATKGTSKKPEISFTFWNMLLFCDVRHVDYLLPIAIAVSGFSAIISLLFVLIYRKRKRVFLFMEETNKVIHSMVVLMTQQLTFIVFMGAVLAYMIIIALRIYSVRVSRVNERGMVEFVTEQSPFILLVPHVIGCLWILEMISSVRYSLVSSAFYRWFFTPLSAQESAFGCRSCWQAIGTIRHLLTCNLGSIALGSILVPPLKLIRFPLIFIRGRLKERQTETARCLSCALSSCLFAFEKFLCYVSRNNYACIAIFGDSFFEGGRRSVDLIDSVRHRLGMRFVLGQCLAVLKLGVVALTALIGVLCLHLRHPQTSVQEFIFPISVACFIALIIASFFINLYGAAFDTMLLCYCDDKKRNNGKDRPFLSTFEFRELMKRHNVWKSAWSSQSLSIPVAIDRLEDCSDNEGLDITPRRSAKRGCGELISVAAFHKRVESRPGLDNFDQLVGKMMQEREKSPLSKRHKSSRIAPTPHNPLPPINSDRPSHVVYPRVELQTPLPGQILEDDEEVVTIPRQLTFLVEKRSPAPASPMSPSLCTPPLQLCPTPPQFYSPPPPKKHFYETKREIPSFLSSESDSATIFQHRHQTSNAVSYDLENPAEPSGGNVGRNTLPREGRDSSQIFHVV